MTAFLRGWVAFSARLGGVFARLDATLPARGVLRGSSRANTPIRIQDGRFALPPSFHPFSMVWDP